MRAAGAVTLAALAQWRERTRKPPRSESRRAARAIVRRAIADLLTGDVDRDDQLTSARVIDAVNAWRPLRGEYGWRVEYQTLMRALDAAECANMSHAGHARPAQVLANHAGAIASRRARSTGTVVTLYDGREAELDVSAGRWQTVCEDHGTVIAHELRRVAQSWLSHPEDWCDECMTAEKAKR